MNDTQHQARWQLLLGRQADEDQTAAFEPNYAQMDSVLEALYEPGEKGKGGLGASSPRISRWLGDIREYFPASVVAIMQKDAMERLGLNQMLMEPEVLATIQPDVHLVGMLMSLGRVMPAKAKDTARQVVRKVVEDLEKRLSNPMRQAVQGALSRSQRNNRPRLPEVNWTATIKRNLKHYQPELKTLLVQQLIGYGRRGQALKEVVLCVDQSGSMASSVVYAGVFGAVLATLKSLKTRMVVFDTAVADLSENLSDPVDLIFGIQLGGGTDINKALAYCQQTITRHTDTVLVLITDLYEGGPAAEMLSRAATLKASGVNLICLLALSDDGAPSFDRQNAEALAAMDIPAFACTPDRFPEVMASALKGDMASTFFNSQ